MEKNFPSYIYDHVFRPVVLTVTTPEAEALIKKHDGLTIAKYLNMHSSINERVRIRLPGSADTERQGFEIVFATPDTLLTPFTNKLHAALVEVPPCQPRASIVVRHKGDAVTYQREYTRTLRSSEEVRLPWSWWYQIWREHRLACSAASEYETAHHPVAVLVCVTRQQLSATSKVWDVRRPPSYWPKYMDSNLPVHYCLVADSDVDTAVQLEECKKATGSNNCHVITVGSLNETDVHRTQEFTRELMLKNIIPDMERGIKTTHDQMQTERKGFSHKWKLWMGGKFSKDEGSEEERYPPASVEQQQRKMGDWAMMLGDWQFAVIHLKQLADVFRADGAVLHRVHALHSTAVALLCNSVPPVTLVQGQQTITVLLSNQIAAQLESLLDAAYRELLKLLAAPLTPARAQLLQALAQRILLLHADVLLVSEVPDAVQAGALFDRLLTGNQSGTDPLAPLSTAPLAAPSLEEHSTWLERALYLEQLALCHLATRPSAMIRKFAFRMFQAGLVYHHLALALAQGATTALVERYYQHALRCFSSSYHVLESHEAAEWSGSSAWSSMLDHAHSLLARLSHRLGLTQHAFTLFARLVQHNQQSATAQASLLREFFHLMRASHVPDSEVTLHFPLLVDINLNDEQLSSQWQSANSLQRLRALKRDKKRQNATKHTASKPQYLRFVVHDDPVERNNSAQAEQLLAEWHWMKMEEALIVSEMSGDKAQLLALKKQQVQYQQQNTRLAVTVPPLAVVHEPFWVELKLFNPLQVPLQLFDLHLLIDFQSTEVDEPKIDNTPFNLLLQPQQRHMVRFALRAKDEGRVTVHGIRFRLVPGVWCVVRLKSPDSKFTEQNSLNMLKRRKFNKSSNNLRRSEDDSEEDNVSLNGSSSPQLKNSLTSPVKRKQSHKRSSSHQDSGNVTPTSSSPRTPSLLSEDTKVSDDHVITVVGVMPRLQVCLVGFNDDVTAKNSSVSDVLRHGAKNSTVFMAQYQPDAESNAELNNVNPNQVVPRDHKITVRGGVIKRLLLNIVNTGHAPIKKICFTHSHPNLFLVPRGEDLELLGDSGDKLTAVIDTKKVNVSHVTRPPTTPQWLSPAQQHIYYQLLATCSHTPLHVTRISLAEILQPGQSLSLPIYYRSPTNLPPVPQLDNVLQHKFLFLAESPKSATTKFRLQKCQVDVKVLPSLRVTSHTRPSHDHLHNHIWSIEFENGSKDSTVVLHELVALSAQWTLTPLSTHSARLPPQSSLNLFFHVQPRDTTAARHSGPWGEDSTVISFDRSDLDEREIQRAFMNKEKAEQHEVEREQQASASGFKPAPLIIVDNAQHELELAAQRRMVSVQSSYNVQLLITWTSQNSATKSRAERGQHHLIDVKFTPNLTPALQPTDLSKQCPLRFVIDSPAVLTHDFARQSLALVPIVFHVTNTSPLASLEYEFETLRPQETVETSNELNSSSDYLWSGTTHRALTTLAPLQSAQFNVTACFARPGRYLINRFKFNVYATDPFTQKKKKLTLYSSSQHLLVIK